jgi:hypothetical protein
MQYGKKAFQGVREREFLFFFLLYVFMSERRRERLVLRAYVYSEIFNGFHKPEEREEITGAQIQMMVDKKARMEQKKRRKSAYGCNFFTTRKARNVKSPSMNYA